MIDAEMISKMDYRCLLLSATAFEFQFCGARGRKKWRGWARSVALQRAEEEEAAAAEGEKRYNCSMFLAVVVSFVVTRHLNRFLVCVG